MHTTVKPRIRPATLCRSSLAGLYFILTLILCIPVVIIAMILSAGTLQSALIHYLGLFVSRPALSLAGVQVEWKGEQPVTPGVYIINHSSTLDILLLLSMGLPRIRFVAKREFLYNPLFLILGPLSGQIFIDRRNSDKAINRLNRALERIRRNRLSVFFAPEGSRNHRGKIGSFKRGAFHMAMDLGYPVVPIHIDNADQLCPGSALITNTGKVTVTFHEPVPTSDWRREQLDEHIKQIRNRYLAWAGMQPELQNSEKDTARSTAGS